MVPSLGNLPTTRWRCIRLRAAGSAAAPSFLRAFGWSSANPCAPREPAAGGRGPGARPHGPLGVATSVLPAAAGGRGPDRAVRAAAIIKSRAAASGLIGPPGPRHKGRFPGNSVDLYRTLRLPPCQAGNMPHDVMWPVLWTVVRTYAPYVTFPVAFVVGAVGYHLEWFIRGKDPQPVEEEKSISERREDRKLDELLGKDHTQVVSLKDKLEFAPKAVLNRNRPEKN
ncbi:hypothetical protein HPG69_014592 [Diceros bicornis minor]|nr:hypothetical protein HPG69_014592 [Diceros bicornis minor]